jgi:hypothetical protein
MEVGMRSALRRELRVALSQKAQPVWFRITKWVALIGLTVALWRTPYLWWWLGGALTLGLAVHFLWRWKTRAWTQPWGGWNDLEAADPPTPSPPAA